MSEANNGLHTDPRIRTEDIRGTRWTQLAWQPVIEVKCFTDSPTRSQRERQKGGHSISSFQKKKKPLLCNKCARNKQTFALGEGLTGDDIASSETWVSCPYHKRNFILNGADAGQCIDDPELSIAAFEVEEREDQWVYLKLPPVEELDRRLGTSRWMVKKSESKDPFERLDGGTERKEAI